MSKKIIQVVTVTGADDSINPEDLVFVAKKYPFVEFGILLSEKRQGYSRFPSRAWLDELFILQQQEKLNLCGHLCGKWVRDFCLGDPTFFKDLKRIYSMFSRIQLNFHTEFHQFDQESFCKIAWKYLLSVNKSIIFQIEGVNDSIFNNCRCSMMLPLFDQSGGVGRLPEKWPKQLSYTYCGYAGGLSPDNLQEQMENISQVASGPIWIDAETLLRSNSDKLFNLEKVCDFLETARPWLMFE